MQPYFFVAVCSKIVDLRSAYEIALEELFLGQFSSLRLI